MKDKGATLDELLDIVQGRTATVADRNEAEIFFDELNIIAGVNWVDDRLVYWRYMKWCLDINRIPVTRKVFIRGAQKRFKRLTSQGKCYFKLDKSIFAVSKEEWEEVQKDYNIEKGKERWSKNVSKAQKERRKKERQAKKEAQRKNKELVESPQQNTMDLKNNSSPE